MGYVIAMFIFNLLIPVLMIIFGRIMYKHAPKSINGVYGYRTSMSMKNEDTWKFAHDDCGRLWYKIGLIMLIPWRGYSKNTVHPCRLYITAGAMNR